MNYNLQKEIQEKIYLLILLLGVSVVLVGCGKSKGGLSVRSNKLSPDTVLSELGDSSFISPQVKCLDFCKGYLYYTDYENGLFVLDSNYQVKKQIGIRGQGPNELLGAAHFYIGNGDSIYILNEGKQSINLFAGGECRQSIPFPQNVRLAFNTRFFVNERQIYHSVIAKEAPVCVFGNGMPEFRCSYTKYDDPTFGRHVTKHVLKGDRGFFLIGCVYPTLQYYSIDGKLVKEFDLSIVPEINEMIEVYHSKPKDPGSYFSVIQDAYFHNNRLYLLVGTLNDGKYRCNTLAVLDMSDTDWKYLEDFRLSGKVYDTFCVYDEKICAHDPSRSCLDVFSLN